MEVNIGDYLSKQIQKRYLNTMNKNESLHSNRIPYMLVDKALNVSLVISPCLQTLCGNMREHRPSTIDFEQLVKLSKIDLNAVEANLTHIKKNIDLKVYSIGYGGFSINVIHFMKLLSEQVGVLKWMDSLVIHEPDYISLTNMFRIYKDIAAKPYDQSFCQNRMKKIQLIDDDFLIARRHGLRFYYFKEHDLNEIEKLRKDTSFKDEKVFIFGAPDFDTRKILEDAPFIFTGHAGNEIEFYSRPIIDSDLTRESYGMIELDYFFVNLLKAAEKMIDIFANVDPKKLPKDVSLWKFDSEKRGVLHAYK